LEIKRIVSARIATFLLLLFSVFATGCAPTATESVLVDSFFSGQAFLDSNRNGQIDEDDSPLADATFIITLKSGGEFGDQTDETGHAFITIPGGVEYPVSARMKAPPDSSLRSIGPSTLSLSEATGGVKFLFSSK
jgi:hypothetical protein